MLHLVFSSRIQSALLERMAAGDTAVFLDDAVYALVKTETIAFIQAAQADNKRLCALNEAMHLRGLDAAQLPVGVETVSYSQLVDLTVDITPIQSWR